eukprot:4634717-Pleurochrysis_carterae.AAC.1
MHALLRISNFSTCSHPIPPQPFVFLGSACRDDAGNLNVFASKSNCFRLREAHVQCYRYAGEPSACTCACCRHARARSAVARDAHMCARPRVDLRPRRRACTLVPTASARALK